MIATVKHGTCLLGSLLVWNVYRAQRLRALAALHKPYPYQQKDYFPVDLLLLAEEAEYSGGRVGAAILARLDEYGQKTDRQHSLILQIGGDTLAALQHQQVLVLTVLSIHGN